MAVSARDPHQPLPEPDPGMRRRHARGQAPRRESSSTWRWFREMGIIVISALVLSALVRAFLVQAFYVPSASMEDTLLVSDRILASKITTTLTGVSRGEVVVFKDPSDWLEDPPPPAGGLAGAVRSAMTFVGVLPSDTGQDLVKRVIGVEGDRVACCDATGHIVLNGVPLVEDYILAPTDQVAFDIIVPPDSVFVMGDNRGNSRDSRFHLEENNGAVPVGNVVGRVVVVVWPFSQFGTVPIPSVFGDPAIVNGPRGIGPSTAPSPSQKADPDSESEPGPDDQ
ncbi:MAG: Signal peptidase [Actinomycetota bacterium]|nr:Signal peptidase [Actinomycetota bacterium]